MSINNEVKEKKTVTYLNDKADGPTSINLPEREKYVYKSNTTFTFLPFYKYLSLSLYECGVCVLGDDHKRLFISYGGLGKFVSDGTAVWIQNPLTSESVKKMPRDLTLIFLSGDTKIGRSEDKGGCAESEGSKCHHQYWRPVRNVR